MTEQAAIEILIMIGLFASIGVGVAFGVTCLWIKITGKKKKE